MSTSALKHYHVKKITDQKVWNDFVNCLNLNTFLHSEAWVEFNKDYGHDTWQLGLYNQHELVGVALVLKIVAKRGTFLFCPHGPQTSAYADYLDLIKLDNQDLPVKSALIHEIQSELFAFTEYLANLGREENASFIRFSPIFQDISEIKELFPGLGFRPAPTHMHHELTTVVDVTSSLDIVLSKMRKTMRQMIKKAENMVAEGEIKMEFVDTITNELHEVYQDTAERGQFVPFSKEYLQAEYDAFKNFADVRLMAVRYQGKVLSWGMYLFAGKRGFYHQGANLLDKNVPASYLCQWTGIKLAKELGCETYDFWGVSPEDEPNHPWYTIGRFKRGFGGTDMKLIHAQDFILSWQYWITWVIETWRAKKRGF